MKRLKELRESFGLSQSKFAKVIDSAQTTISGWETGQRSLSFDNIIMLSNFFNVSTDYLLGTNNDELYPISYLDKSGKEISHELFKNEREKKRLSIEELSDLTGVSNKAIEKYEKGEKTIMSNVFTKLLKGMNITINEFEETYSLNNQYDTDRDINSRIARAAKNIDSADIEDWLSYGDFLVEKRRRGDLNQYDKSN